MLECRNGQDKVVVFKKRYQELNILYYIIYIVNYRIGNVYCKRMLCLFTNKIKKIKKNSVQK